MNASAWRWRDTKAARIVRHPAAFALQVLKGFRANQGLLLAGAVAYYALLSIVPLLILAVIALSHVVDQAELLRTIGRYLEWLVPGQSRAIVAELANFLAHRGVLGWVLLASMLFFSSLAFTVLENAMSVVFHHRVVVRRRHFLVSAIIPYAYILSLGVGLLFVTLVAGSLQAMGEREVDFLGRRYLEWLVPGQSGAIVAELANFLMHRNVMGWVLLVSMLFFSSLAFTVLENAMSVIFHHRVVVRRRHFLVSAIIPYAYILSLGVGLLFVTLVAGSLQAMGEREVDFLGRRWSLEGMSGLLLYLLGLVGEIFVLTSVYMVMPVGRPSVWHALLGAVAAALLWEVSRHVLVWYFSTLSQIGTVYGSLTTAIAVLLSLEVAAALLLLGAQVISAYERYGDDAALPAPPFTTAPR